MRPATSQGAVTTPSGQKCGVVLARKGCSALPCPARRSLRVASVSGTSAGAVRLNVSGRRVLPCVGATRQGRSIDHTAAEATHSTGSGSDAVTLGFEGCWWLLGGLLTAAGPAAAGEAVSYDPSGANQYFENVAGFLYVILVVWFLSRTISRRVKKFTTERISSGVPSSTPAPSTSENEDDEDDSVIVQSDQDKAATPIGALTGAALAFVISVILYQFCLKVDDYFDHQTISTQFTVQKLQITIQTIVRGLVYLCTFTFAANAAGLVGLAGALVFNPESVRDEVIVKPKRDPLLDISASKRLGKADLSIDDK